jgi:RND family efflux transporter MFP subunit
MKKTFWLLAIIALVFAGLSAYAVYRRAENQRQWSASTQSSGRQIVAVIQPQPAADIGELVLPANVQAFQETPIYARTNGYVKRWHTDMGAPVKAGQLLAEVDTPEIDQEFLQAQATLDQAIANRDLAQKTDARWQKLITSHTVAQQEADQYAAQLRAREADVRAAKANVQRLRSLQGFKEVRAPFEGIVTARSLDVGSLVSSGNTQPLFRIAQARTLRVYAAVPQSASPAIRTGLDANLEIPEFPGRRFPGKVAGTAGAIDPVSRTLNTEIQVPNPRGELLPGAFGRIHLHLDNTHRPLTIPATTLIFRGQGAQVATVDQGSKVHLKTVKLGRDLGESLEVLEGLGADDRIVLNPADSLADGEMVAVVGEPL